MLFEFSLLSWATLDLVTQIRAVARKGLKLSSETVNDNIRVLVPLFGDIKYFKNRDYLEECGLPVTIVIPKNDPIKKQIGQGKFEVVEVDVPKDKVVAWALFKKFFEADNYTGYSILLDGDTYPHIGQMRSVQATMEAHNLDMASMRVLVDNKKKNLLTRMQGMEYYLAMRCRKVYPFLTSGAYQVAKSQLYKFMFANHSFLFSSGDIQLGMMADKNKFKVGYIPAEAYTTVPETFRSWVRQRLFWSAGGFRINIINAFYFQMRKPWFFFYGTIIVFLLAPLRIYTTIVHPHILLAILPIYWLFGFMFLTNGEWSWHAVFLPFYYFINSTILTILGIGRYLYDSIKRRSSGYMWR